MKQRPGLICKVNSETQDVESLGSNEFGLFIQMWDLLKHLSTNAKSCHTSILVTASINNTEFLHSGLSSNEFEALYVLLLLAMPAHLYTLTSQLLKEIYNSVHVHGWSMYNTFLCELLGCQVLIYGWVKWTIFWVEILPRDCRYWRLSVRQDAHSQYCVWEPSSLSTQSLVLPK